MYIVPELSRVSRRWKRRPWKSGEDASASRLLQPNDVIGQKAPACLSPVKGLSFAQHGGEMVEIILLYDLCTDQQFSRLRDHNPHLLNTYLQRNAVIILKLSGVKIYPCPPRSRLRATAFDTASALHQII